MGELKKPNVRRSFSKRRFIVLSLVTVVIAAGVWSGFRMDRSQSEIRRILLISVDTCRADYLSCYGYPRATTPHIDDLAREGVLFENVISPVPMTLPAHSSMLTGMNPSYHSVHDNLGYQLDTGHETLAEILKNNGFLTGAIVSAFVLDSQFGLNQGFDSYNDRFEEVHLVHDSYSERKGKETTRLAREWLDEQQDEPFFLFLHYFDPHEDYDPPEPFKSRFSGSGASLRARLNDAYAAEIAYTDYCIGQVFDKLKALGLYDSTLIILVGDHGELLGEHGEPTHTYYIYQNAIRVPLLYKMPGRRKPAHVESLVGIIDIVPTICGLLDIAPPPSVQGIDLSGHIRTDTNLSAAERYVYCESFRPTIYDANPLLGVVSHDGWKYIQTTRPELYHLDRDPGETNNLAGQEPQRERFLQSRLQEILDKQQPGAPVDQSRYELDDEAVKKLAGLGYVGGGDLKVDFEFNRTRDDPKDLFMFHMAHQEVDIELARKNYRRAKTVAEKMSRLRPDFYPAYKNLARISLEQNDLPAAIPHLQEMIRLHPDDAESFTNLGAIFQSQGNIDQAAKYYRDALKADPNYANAHNNLGNALIVQGKPDEAIDHLERAQQLRPDYAEAHYNLGKALHLTGQSLQAVKHFRAALGLRSNWPEALRDMAWILATRPDANVRDGPAALRAAQQASELTRNTDPATLNALAAAQAAVEDYLQAVATAEKALEQARATGQEQLVNQIRLHLKLYQQRRPMRQPVPDFGR